MRAHGAPWTATGLHDVVKASPRWSGPDQGIVRQGGVAVIGVLATAVLVGGTAGLGLVWALARALAYLS
jgi:hypothetical protein